MSTTAPVVSDSTSLSTQILAGVLLTALGVADLLGFVSTLADYSYAVVWWGVLLLADSWNFRQRGLSLWRGDSARFFAITLPLSVLVWLLFEALNVPSPQWRYRVGISSTGVKVLYGFASFSTVIPIMAESWWLVSGRQCLPAPVARWFRDHKFACLITAAILASMPFLNTVFWFNQGIWLIPALVFLPFIHTESCTGRRFTRTLVISALIAGLAWETLNYLSLTHWEYLVLPNAPHLFFMPIAGYLGFIPFAFSMLAAYEFTRSVRPSIALTLMLYAGAFAGLYLWTTLYVDHL